jgi:hypothetical protein
MHAAVYLGTTCIGRECGPQPVRQRSLFRTRRSEADATWTILSARRPACGATTSPTSELTLPHTDLPVLQLTLHPTGSRAAHGCPEIITYGGARGWHQQEVEAAWKLGDFITIFFLKLQLLSDIHMNDGKLKHVRVVLLPTKEKFQKHFREPYIYYYKKKVV